MGKVLQITLFITISLSMSSGGVSLPTAGRYGEQGEPCGWKRHFQREKVCCASFFLTKDPQMKGRECETCYPWAIPA